MQYRILVKHNNTDTNRLTEILHNVKKFFQSEIDVVWTYEDKNWGYHRILEAFDGITVEIIVKNILYDLHREVNVICPDMPDLGELFTNFKNAYSRYNKPILGIVTHNPQMDDVLGAIKVLKDSLEKTQGEYQAVQLDIQKSQNLLADNQKLITGYQQEIERLKAKKTFWQKIKALFKK